MRYARSIYVSCEGCPLYYISPALIQSPAIQNRKCNIRQSCNTAGPNLRSQYAKYCI